MTVSDLSNADMVSKEQERAKRIRGKLDHDLASIFARFNHVLLPFSGGKESVTLAHGIERWADRVTLIWLNTGDSAVGMPDFVRGFGDRFNLVEVEGNPRASWARLGPPADIVPVSLTLPNTSGRKLQPRVMCCALGRNLPLYGEIERIARRLRDAGATVAQLNGQRRDDFAYSREEEVFKNPFPPPFWPLWEWTEGDVLDHVKSNGISLAPHYAEVVDSMDCISCPADMTVERLQYLKRHHPQIAREVQQTMMTSLGDVMEETRTIMDVLEQGSPS